MITTAKLNEPTGQVSFGWNGYINKIHLKFQTQRAQVLILMYYLSNKSSTSEVKGNYLFQKFVLKIPKICTENYIIFEVFHCTEMEHL